MVDDDNPLSQVIRRLRLAQGWTQEEFAQIAGVSRRTVSEAEGSNIDFGRLNLATFIKLLDALGLQIDVKEKIPPTLDDLLQENTAPDSPFKEDPTVLGPKRIRRWAKRPKGE